MLGNAVIVASVLVGASAFAPSFQGARVLSRVSRSSSSMKMVSVDSLIGADKETGGVWDPLGLAKGDADVGKYRAAELKHGRVAMLAVLGVIVQSYVSLPDPVFANGGLPQTAAAQLFSTRPEALLQIFLACGFVELVLLKQDPAKPPGNLGWGSYPKSEKEYEVLQLKELKNGRLAMLAITGEFVQEKLTGQGPVEQLLAGHTSPFGDGQGFF